MSYGSSERPITVYGAIAANAVIAASKFAVGTITGSSAMLSEAIHSVVDTGNELLLLLGIHRSQKPADLVHSIERIAGAASAVLGVSRPLTMHFGPKQVLLNLDIEFRPNLSASQVTAAVDRLDAGIRRCLLPT